MNDRRAKFERTIDVHESDLVQSVRYDSDAYVLDVKMKSGSIYRYRSIYGVTFSELITAKSFGKVYNKKIRHLPSLKLTSRSSF